MVLYLNSTFSVFATAAAPDTFLQVDDGTLRVTAGKAVRLKLRMPERQTWSLANIVQLQVRTFGKVETIEPPVDQGVEELTYKFDAPGYAMLLLAAGPNSTKGRVDSVRRTPYCAKLLVRVDADPSADTVVADPLKSPGFTAKAGMKIEVSPYIDPTSLSREAVLAGADLPVRAYFDGGAQSNATVMAQGPDGTQQHRTTDGVGIARIRIDQPGRWLVRYQHVDEGLMYTGDLLFDVGITSREEGE